MLNRVSSAKLKVVSSSRSASSAASLGELSLKHLAQIDPEVRGFLRAIKETGLREKAVELIRREIRRKKDN